MEVFLVAKKRRRIWKIRRVESLILILAELSWFTFLTFLYTFISLKYLHRIESEILSHNLKYQIHLLRIAIDFNNKRRYAATSIKFSHILSITSYIIHITYTFFSLLLPRVTTNNCMWWIFFLLFLFPLTQMIFVIFLSLPQRVCNSFLHFLK